jgi:invasion protein IalB
MEKGETEMKRKITILAIAAAMLLTAAPAPAALAANGQPPVNGCQPGAENGIVQSWQLLDHEGFVKYLMNGFGYEDKVAAEQRSEIMFAFCDHNGDGQVCVMQQNLPNDASGRSTYWLAEDNHPFGGR